VSVLITWIIFLTVSHTHTPFLCVLSGPCLFHSLLPLCVSETYTMSPKGIAEQRTPHPDTQMLGLHMDSDNIYKHPELGKQNKLGAVVHTWHLGDSGRRTMSLRPAWSI
jgi:hypothetical protein